MYAVRGAVFPSLAAWMAVLGQGPGGAQRERLPTHTGAPRLKKRYSSKIAP
jgi:hypothetical protein